MVRQIRNDFFKPTFLPKKERINSTLLKLLIDKIISAKNAICKEVVKKPITELMCDVIKKVAPRFLKLRL